MSTNDDTELDGIKNFKAYQDVYKSKGPSMPDDEEYMERYRFWYPLGPEYQKQLKDAVKEEP